MAVSVVRTSTYVDSSTPIATTFFSGTPTIGNYVAVTTTEYSTSQCVCTDDATGGSNSYTTHRAANAFSNSASIARAKLDRTKANLGVTVNCGSGLFAAGAIEISGVVSTNPVDLDSSQTTDTTSPWTLALSSPAQTDEILIAAFSFAASSFGTHNITADQWTGATPTTIFVNDGPSINGEYGAGAYLITTDLTARTVSFSANNNGGQPSPIQVISLKGAPAAPTLDQKAYRYFNDDGSESGSTPMAAQNTNVNVAAGTNFRIRFGIQATGDPSGIQIRLEYDEVSGSNWKGVT
jgi:hypothetical protein